MDNMQFIKIAIAILIFILSKYNKIVKLENKVKQAKSGIDVYLNQRFELNAIMNAVAQIFRNFEKVGQIKKGLK